MLKKDILSSDHDLRDAIVKVRMPRNLKSYDEERKMSTC